MGCLISALKKAEDRQEVILRLFNPAESATCDATVAFSREVISCSETMMDEHITTEENQGSNLSGPFTRPVTDVQLPACLNSNQTEATYARPDC